jgi:hypothetical protein
MTFSINFAHSLAKITNFLIGSHAIPSPKNFLKIHLLSPTILIYLQLWTKLKRPNLSRVPVNPTAGHFLSPPRLQRLRAKGDVYKRIKSYQNKQKRSSGSTRLRN